MLRRSGSRGPSAPFQHAVKVGEKAIRQDQTLGFIGFAPDLARLFRPLVVQQPIQQHQIEQ